MTPYPAPRIPPRILCAEAVPDVLMWLPTREIETARAVLKERIFPDNLRVRVSATKIDGNPPRMPYTSVVTTGETNTFDCRSRHQGNVCGDCRACWSEEPVIAYRLHGLTSNRMHNVYNN